MQDGRWELVAAFLDVQTAISVARARGRGVRLVRATYEDGRQTSQEVLMNTGGLQPVQQNTD